MHSIIVTGAGKGLGEAITKTLVGDGYSVLAIDRDAGLLESLKAKLRNNVNTFQLDVADYGAVGKFFEKISNEATYGLVNNAGIYFGQALAEYSVEDIDKVIDINLKGAIYFSKYFGELMVNNRREGVIVNISSSSIYGGADPVYSATKSGLVGLTKSCAKAFSPFVRVNAVAPGIVLTDIFANIPEQVVKWYRDAELVKEPLVPEDVANTVSFLMSEKGRNYSGAVFDLNNGFHL